MGREAGATADRLRDLERAKDNFAVELATVRERARSEHEDRLEAEVGRIREQSARELGEIRNNGREVIERENKALREGRIDALQASKNMRWLSGFFILDFVVCSAAKLLAFVLSIYIHILFFAVIL